MGVCLSAPMRLWPYTEGYVPVFFFFFVVYSSNVEVGRPGIGLKDDKPIVLPSDWILF